MSLNASPNSGEEYSCILKAKAIFEQWSSNKKLVFMKNPVKLCSSNQSFEIEILKAKLEEKGIDSYILNKQDSAYVVIGEIELYVEESDLAKAKDIIGKQ